MVFVGEVGITVVTHWAEPTDNDDPQHREASERYLQCMLGWFANPIFGDGDYPEVMRDFYKKKMIEGKLDKPILPSFTEKEKARNKGGLMFLHRKCQV